MKSSIAALFLAATCLTAIADRTTEVAVYGATPGGVAAAVSAARDGRSVLLLEESSHLGGLTAGGLSHTDFRTFESLGGIWREFMDEVIAHYTTTYGPSSPQLADAQNGGFYEPKVARMIFEDMLSNAGVTVLLRHRLESATTAPSTAGRTRLNAASFTDLDASAPCEIDATVFIDATYEGDLFAAAGVPSLIGEDGQSVFGEEIAPPSSNDFLQVYNFRVTLSKAADRLPIPAPAGYDKEDFRTIIDAIVSNQVTELEDIIRGPSRPVPNDKADFNDLQGSPQSLRIFDTRPWADQPAARPGIADRARYQALGLFHTLLTDPEVAATANGQGIMAEMNQWGLPPDEYPDNNNFSPALYVREARRMIGAETFTEANLKRAPGSLRTPSQATAIAMGDYNSSSHGTRLGPGGETLGVINNFVRTWPHRPYEIPYAIMLPQAVDGLLVPVAASSSHIGFCALRLEPIWTALGQAAGLAASQAVASASEVGEIDVRALQRTLHANGALTFYTSDVPPGAPHYRAVQYFGNRGFFHDLYPSGADGGLGPTIPGPNQWSEAFKNHDVRPATLMTDALAIDWLAKYAALPAAERSGADTLLIRNEALTRGEFLDRLLDEPAVGRRVPQLPDATVGQPFTHILLASGAPGPLVWSFADGTLPPGLGLTDDVISGTPTAAGYFSFRLDISGSGGFSARREFQIGVSGSESYASAADTYIQLGTPTTNYGNSDKLIVKNQPGNDFAREGFLRFDLGGATATPQRAELRITPTRKYSDTDATRFRFALVRDADDGWIEGDGGTDNNPPGELTWNAPRPQAAGGFSTDTVTPYVVNQTLALDVTAMVLETLANDPAALLSLKVTGVEEGSGNLIDFATREHPTAALRPALVLLFEDPLSTGYHEWRQSRPFEMEEAGYPLLDADGDGQSNYEEFLGGTDPLDPGARTGLRIEAGPLLSYDSRVASGTGYHSLARYYTIERSPDLATPWLPIPAHRDVPASGFPISFPPAEAGNPKAFYRLRWHLLPQP